MQRPSRPLAFPVVRRPLSLSLGHLRIGAAHAEQAIHKYLKALEAGDADKAAALFTVDGVDGWVQSPFLGRLSVRDYITKVAGASNGTRSAG